MQVYQRIVNPYMPQGIPTLTNAPTPVYSPGELGCAFNDQNTGFSFLRVLLDPAANSGTTVGVVAVGQIAYWKDRAKAIVTNDKNACDVGTAGSINRVAGIFMTAVTGPGVAVGTDGQTLYYMCDIVIAGKSVPVAATGTIVNGSQVIVDTTANTARIICPAAVTTAPVSQVVGVAVAAAIVSGKLLVDVAVGLIA